MLPRRAPMIELTVLGAGPAYTVAARRRRGLVPVRQRGRGDRARPRPGRIHEPGRDDRAELAAGGRDQPPPPGPLHRPRPAAPLPAVASSTRRDGSPSSGRPDWPTGSTRSTTSPGSRRRRSTSPISAARGPRRSGRSTVEARLVRHTDESYGFRCHRRARPGPRLLRRLRRRRDLRAAHPARRHPAGRGVVRAGAGAAGSEHLNAADVGRLAAAAGAGRVLLTHFLMGHDRGTPRRRPPRAWPGRRHVVDPGDRFSI